MPKSISTDKENAVYLLKPIFDDPRYTGFHTKVWGTVPDSVPETIRGRRWRVYRFARWWKPVSVAGAVRRSNDCPWVNFDYPALSERAVEALRDFLEPNGELLPLASKGRDYYMYNLTTVADVIHRRRSKIVWLRYPAIASNILDHQFHPDRLAGQSIFRIPEKPRRIYVTEAFVRRVHAHGLDGFNFAKLWPLPPGTDWEKLHRQQNRKRARTGLPAGKTLKGNFIVLTLRLAGVNSKGSAEEHSKIKRLLDDLDDLLTQESSAPPIGHLEGHNYEDGKCRIALSCPDAGALAKTISATLRKLKWKPGVTVQKYRRPFETFTEFWGD